MKKYLVSLIPLWILFHVVAPQGVQNCGSYDDERSPDPKSCYSYYECHNGVSLKKTCSFGMVYNCFFKFCTFKVFAPCCRYDPHPPPTENGCLNLGIKIPNPFVCNKYFECRNWQIREVACPRGTRYDFIDMKCVDSRGCRCAPGTVIDNTTETTTPMSKKTTKMTPAHIMTTQQVITTETTTDTTPTSELTTSQTHETTMTTETTQKSTETSNTAITTPIDMTTTEIPTEEPSTNSPTAQVTTTTSIPSLTTQTSVEISTLSTLKTSTELSTYTIEIETSTAEMTSGEPSTTASTSQMLTTTSNPSITIDTSTGTSTLETMSTEMSTYTSEATTTTIIQTTRCPINGIKFPDTSRCTRYYECQNGEQFLKTCRFRFFYNCFLQRCSIFTYTPCCKDDQYPVRNNEYCTQLGKKVPNPYDCTKYFECRFFRIEEFSCPHGQLFDLVTNMCVNGNTYECIPSSRNGTTGTWETTVATCSTTTENPWTEWFNTTNKFDTTESTYFTEGGESTSLSTSTERSSTSEEEIIVFSTEATKNTSDNSSDLCQYDGIKFPDTRTCRNYYECVDEKPTSRTCPLDLVFNCFLSICTLRAFTPCCKYDPTLPPYDGTCFGLEVKIPDPLECNKYYQCKNFKIMEQICPFGQKYDWLEMNCVDAGRCHCAPGL